MNTKFSKNWTFTADEDTIPWVKFHNDLETNDYKFHETVQWQTEVHPKMLYDLEGYEYYHRMQASKSDIHTFKKIEDGSCYIRTWTSGGSVYFIRAKIAHKSLDVIDGFVKELKEKFPVAEPTEEGKITVNFWTYSNHGPDYNTRKIVAPDWEEIEGNYPNVIQEPLDKLIKLDPSDVEGQLIILSGLPGSGKSTWLRSLCKYWSKWAVNHFIVDPENFFGNRSDYMMEVILKDWGEDDNKWKLLILEDSGEMLRADAKQNVGQGLSRLLNVVDGFIGQGLKLLVLITTNEEVGKLNPAVTRPGRCLSNIEFDKLSKEESKEWAKKHNIEVENQTYTLAELYAILRGEKVNTTKSFGF